MALYAGVHTATVASIIAGLFLYYSFAHYGSSPKFVLIGLGFIILSYTLRSVDAISYARSNDKELRSKRYFKQYALVTYISSIAWSMYFLALFPEEGQHQVYIMFCAVGVVTAAISSLSYSRIIIYGYMGVIMLPLFARLYIEGTEAAITLMMLNIILMVFLLISVNKFYHNFLHNLELVLTTQAQDEKLLRHHQKLEQEVQERTQELEKMAHYDALTLLPNRHLFTSRFSESIAHSSDEAMLAICFIDLDEFKTVNDTYGHDIGDQLLIGVTERIKENIRDGDTLSRQGGDEFTLLLDEVESFDQCDRILTRIHQSLALPFYIEGYTIQISASSGMTIYPLDNGDMDTLLRHADQAMYSAKLAGRNRYQIFNPQEAKEQVETNKQLQEIKDALVNEEFCLYYQPKINMRTGEVLGVEALIRWQHPQKGMIAPLNFLPISEGTIYEIEIGDWVVNHAVSQLESWRKQNIHFGMSINVSSNYLQSPLFISGLKEILDKYPDIRAKNVQLEILESSALGDLKMVADIVRACRDILGVSVALDDFGTGYSSLTHLKDLAADTIKIDQSFIRSMLKESSDCAIIEGVINLAKTFDREVIAEGVETIEHGLMLLNMGCEQAQGYVIARPMPAEELQDWLDSYIPNKEWVACKINQNSEEQINS